MFSQHVSAIQPVHAGQKCMFIFQRLNPESTAYHHTVAIELSGELNIPILKQALTALVKRHESLRSAFAEDKDGIITQVVYEDVGAVSSTWPLNEINMGALEETPIDMLPQALNFAGHGDFLNKPFNLLKPPLWRAGLLKYKEGYQFIFVIHHSIFDVHSQNVLLSELSILYNFYLEKEFATFFLESKESASLSLPKKPSIEELKYNPVNNISKRLLYWKQALKNLPELKLDTFCVPDVFKKNVGDRVKFNIKAANYKAIKEMAHQFKSSPHQIFLGALYILLMHYTEETDLCVGSASANRREEDYSHNPQSVVNCFVNSVPLRMKLIPQETFIMLLAKISKMASESYKNQVPLDLLLEQNISNPFKIILVHNDNKKTLSLKGTRATVPIELNLQNIKFDLGINLDEQLDGSLEGFVEFKAQAFNETWINSVIRNLESLLRAVVKNPHAPIASYSIMGKEHRLALATFNTPLAPLTKIHFPRDLFREAANENPDKTAVIFHDENNLHLDITWRELDYQSNRLAMYLLSLGFDRQKVAIGVCLPRSVSLIIAMIAIYKIGGIAVPLETEKGHDFDKKMIALTQRKITDGAVIILHNAETAPLFDVYKDEVFPVNFDDREKMDLFVKKKASSASLEKISLSPDDIAYVRFTSGTTGVPKAIKISYANLYNFFCSLKYSGYFNLGDKVLSNAPYTFDAIEFDIFVWFLTKGELHLPNERDRVSPQFLQELIRTENLNVITLLPQVLKFINPKNLTSPTSVITMGEKCDPISVKTWRYYLAKRGGRLLNGYGPSETTVGTHIHPFSSEEHFNSIGLPLANVQAYIVNNSGQECDFYVPGEIWLAGANLSPGYVDEATTAERFKEKIFDTHARCFYDVTPEIKKELEGKRHEDSESKEMKIIKPTEFRQLLRIYKTGDHGFRDAKTGSIVILGRKDLQVKIEGVRLELFALRAQLCLYPGVKNAEVVVSEKKALIVFLVLEDSVSPESISLSKLNTYLRAKVKLGAVLCVPSIPLSKHGKVDHKKLLEIFHSHPESKKISAASSTLNPLQLKIRKCWAKVLDREEKEITGQTDFFDLGGSSLRLVRFEFELNKEVMPQLSPTCRIYLRELLDNAPGEGIESRLKFKTIEEMANFISQKIITEKLDAYATAPTFFQTKPEELDPQKPGFSFLKN